MNILIVDDSSTARMFIKRCLMVIGFEDAQFTECENGKQALFKLKTGSHDFVLADLNMPVMDGESMLKWMKTIPETANIPLIFITSANNDARTAQLKELGAFDVLGKPVNPPLLAKVTKELLAQKSAT